MSDFDSSDYERPAKPESKDEIIAALKLEVQRCRDGQGKLTAERDEAKAALAEHNARACNDLRAQRNEAINDKANAEKERDEAKAALADACAGANQAAELRRGLTRERDSLRSKVAELEAKLVEATKVKAALPFRWRCIECESGSGVFPTEAEAEMAGQEHASTCPARLKLIDQIAAYRLVVADLARGGK